MAVVFCVSDKFDIVTMKKMFAVLLLVWSFTIVSADKEHVSAMVGGVGSLHCAVDRSKCGEVHSLKWYRGEQRIYVFSETGGIARKEGDMSDRLEVVHETNSTAAELRISPVRAEDEGVFRCELTYLLVGEDCDTVQLLHFRTLMKPTSVRVADGSGNAILNGSTIGPLKEGTDIKLECVVTGGRPTPSVVWTIRGKKIAGETTTTEMDVETGHVVSNIIKLVLTRAELAAQLQCEIVSDALDESIKILMDVDVNVRPTKISLTGVDKHAIHGSKVALECLVQGARPAANLTWYNGTDPIDPEKVTSIANVQADGTYDTQSSFSFLATRFENGQKFRCEAENIVNREESEKPLHATRPLEVLYPPIVSVRPENITVNETVDFTLFCEYEANPASLTSVTWIQNGKELNIAAEPWKYDGGTTEQQALVIRNSSSRDLGSFACKLANSVGSAFSPTSVYVDVHYKPKVKIWMEPPGPVIESERQNVTLHCEVVDGNPPLLSRARWFLDKALMKELPDCNTTKEQEEQASPDAEDMCKGIDPSRLLLEPASRNFHGNFSCEGENLAGWGPVSESAELLVYYEPGPATLTYSPARVIKAHSVVLTCKVEELGRPAATRYQWYRGARPIPDVVTSSWTIDPVTLETAANFTCRAVNEAGMGDPATVVLEVLAPPNIINNFPPYTGALYNAENINISCRVECSPSCNVQWLKDGRPISSSAPYHRIDTAMPPNTRTNDFESVLSYLIWNMTMWPGGVLDRNRDNANYTCQSSENGVGPGVTSLTVFGVEYPPENITVSNKVISVVENNIPDKVHCYAKGNPDPSYIWKLSNMTNQQNNAKATMNTDSLHQRFKDGILSKRNSLVLDRPVQRFESGDLICEAKNKHGSSRTTTYLNVMYKPECGITQTESEGYQVLVCAANANPTEVVFTWRLKNENDSLGAAEVIKQQGLKSILRLDPAAQNFRTYICVATNQVGSSIACERDVAAGSLPWWRRLEQEPLILSGAMAILLLIILLLCIPMIYYCRRRNSDKSSGLEKAGSWHNLTMPPRVAGSGASGAMGGSDERDTYQNLSFHGLQHPPPSKERKPRASDTYIY